MSIVFHGSPLHQIEVVVPKQNRRTQMVDEKLVTVFDQLSFHASPFRWIALAYLYRENALHHMGVNLYGEKAEVLITGPNTLEESLAFLYGNGGYLHLFDAKDFWWCEGLGSCEVITNKQVCPLEIKFIKDPISEMKEDGVQFLFTKKSLS